MDNLKIHAFVNQSWDESALPQVIDYIRIPNKSPVFDPDWQEHGHMDQAVALIERWCLSLDIPGMQLEVVRQAGRTPLIFMDIPGQSDRTILLYGHLDKQPEISSAELPQVGAHRPQPLAAGTGG